MKQSHELGFTMDTHRVVAVYPEGVHDSRSEESWVSLRSRGATVRSSRNTSADSKRYAKTALKVTQTHEQSVICSISSKKNERTGSRAVSRALGPALRGGAQRSFREQEADLIKALRLHLRTGPLKI